MIMTVTSMLDNVLRIATRQSPLALWQAHYVKDKLMASHPGLVVELVPMVTRGDVILDTPLAKVGVQFRGDSARQAARECAYHQGGIQYRLHLVLPPEEKSRVVTRRECGTPDLNVLVRLRQE